VLEEAAALLGDSVVLEFALKEAVQVDSL